MTKIKLTIYLAISIIILIAVAGIYKFNFTDNDIFYSGTDIQQKDYYMLYGSWVQKDSDSGFEDGFTLNQDGSASSINMATLIYKKWKISGDKLILTALSLGNHSASIFEDTLTISYYNSDLLGITKYEREYIYKKVDSTSINANRVSLSENLSFEYFPADYDNNIHIEKKMPVDLSSNDLASKFKTQITNQYDTTDINFAAHYVAITWGCGSNGCQQGVMVDARDGKIYNLPTFKDYSDIGNELIIFKESILMKTSFGYWLWNEQSKEFVFYSSL